MVRIYRKAPTGAKKLIVMKNKQVATKAFVRKAINKNIETRFIEAQKIETSSNTLGTPMYLDDIATLSTSSIVGQRVLPRGISLRYVVNNNSTQYGVIVRMLVLKNKLGRNYTAYRAGTDIFEDQTNNYSTTGTLYDITRRINKDRYIVLKDQTMRLGYSAVDGSSFKNGKLWIPLKGQFQYDGAAIVFGAANPETMNPLVLILAARADNDVALGEVVECTLNSTFYYKDA